ncbi:carboxylesterase family protein [Nocardioides sp. 1609]|uniref:carboxylesterase family protein n=1 Tax=Nocardioides sp. 1609 TaxID=2508327 RepID=UPI0010702329|nr:carboxylesterase family protein [Nocardioides sp. 1609]
MTSDEQVRTAPRFECAAGVVVGWRDAGVVRATGLRYARAERHAAPVAEPAVPAEDGPILATSWAPACPQVGSPLLQRMFPAGFGDLDQDEHCQALSVTLPEDAAPGDDLPVMVFFHGGSYVSGAGDVPMHDPATLVREERVVVVSVNYRLGLFGFLGDADRPANLGLLDQVEALRWVRRNVRGFGGDPGNVTAFGESAGADAVLHLMVADGAAGLFRRAIVQSAPLGITRGREAMSEAMAAEAGSIPEDAPAEEVLGHYERVNDRARSFGLLGGMPFGVQYGRSPVPAEDDVEAAWAAVAPDVDVLIGTNSRETAFFVSEVPAVARLGGLPVVGRALVEPLVRALTWRIYTRDAVRWLRRHRASGGRGGRYTISWGPRGSRLTGAHTIDLALLFPNPDGWAGSPLVEGVDWDDVVAAGRPVRRLWAAFARTGELTDPGCGHLTLH